MLLPYMFTGNEIKRSLYYLDINYPIFYSLPILMKFNSKIKSN